MQENLLNLGKKNKSLSHEPQLTSSLPNPKLIVMEAPIRAGTFNKIGLHLPLSSHSRAMVSP